MKYIHDGDFCLMNTDKHDDIGIKRGQRVYIAGHRAVPISAEDPYTQRIKFFCHTVDNGLVTFGKIYMFDALSLKHVGKKEADKLRANLKKLIGEASATD